jgi:3-oxoadipate enol-lactonase
MVREAYVEVSGRRQRYLEAGAGWPLILLHPFPLHADFWRPQLERITRGWRCLAPDLRGFGPAAAGPAVATMDDLADGVAGFMDALEIEKAVIGGLSMGGYVAMSLYRAARERVTALVLANTRAGAEPPEGRAARDAMIALVRAQGPGAVADQMMPKLLGQTSRRARQHLAPLVRRLIESNTAEGIAAAIQAIRDRPDSMSILERCAVPGLVITGEEDTIIPVAESEAMARALPRAQLVVLAAAGHLSSLELPDDFSEALGNFLLANL